MILNHRQIVKQEYSALWIIDQEHQIKSADILIKTSNLPSLSIRKKHIKNLSSKFEGFSVPGKVIT